VTYCTSTHTIVKPKTAWYANVHLSEPNAILTSIAWVLA